MKILIAEDMAVARVTLTAAVQKLKHETIAVEDGAQAWEHLQKGEFPLVITDWQMPHVDGLELCRRIRAASQRHYTYIIMLTSMDTRADYMVAIDAGADDFLVKPFDHDVLIARLHVAQRIGGLLTDMQQLQSLLPVCRSCRKIRNEHEQWMNLENYASTHQTTFDQIECPQCLARREATRQFGSQLSQMRRDMR